jgi:hypothetical protein
VERGAVAPIEILEIVKRTELHKSRPALQALYRREIAGIDQGIDASLLSGVQITTAVIFKSR